MELRIRVSLSLAIAATCAVVWTGCSVGRKTITAEPAAYIDRPPEFVGNSACVECHPKQCRSHALTGHAQSLRWATRESLGTQFPPIGKIPNTIFGIDEDKGRLVLVLYGKKSIRIPVDLAFGAGSSGIAFASRDTSTSFVRAYLSYFPDNGKWFVDPGSGHEPDSAKGNLVVGDEARRCVQCHAVELPKESVFPETKYLGVGCESCHGPGSVHIAIAKTPARLRPRGEHNWGIEQINTTNGLFVNELCGKCHAAGPTNVKTIKRTGFLKYQTDSLSRSQCFIRSLGKLTCLSCHKPHERLSHDTRNYEAVCVTCHSAASTPRPDIDENTGVVCPVNKKDRCLECHMPRRPLFPGMNLPTTMTDHLIRIPQSGTPSSDTVHGTRP